MCRFRRGSGGGAAPPWRLGRGAAANPGRTGGRNNSKSVAALAPLGLGWTDGAQGTQHCHTSPGQTGRLKTPQDAGRGSQNFSPPRGLSWSRESGGQAPGPAPLGGEQRVVVMETLGPEPGTARPWFPAHSFNVLLTSAPTAYHKPLDQVRGGWGGLSSALTGRRPLPETP